jgi:hypothetical protein
MDEEQFSTCVEQLEVACRAMTSAQRDGVIDSILRLCDSHNLFRLSLGIEALTRRDFLKCLPREVAEHILCFLEWKSLLVCREVSHAWMTLVDSSSVAWKSACIDVGADVKPGASSAEEYQKLCQHACIARARLVKGTAFEKMTIGGCPAPISAIHYFNNKIITGWFPCLPINVEITLIFITFRC